MSFPNFRKKNMNSITKTLILLFILICSITNAQNPRRERIRAQKVAFITDQLQLTTTEAEKFWPIYNNFEKNTQKLKRNDMRKLRNEFDASGGDSISNEEAERFLDRLITIEEKLYNQKRKLIKDLRQVIPAKKIIKLRRVEEEFNKTLIKKFRELRQRGNLRNRN